MKPDYKKQLLVNLTDRLKELGFYNDTKYKNRLKDELRDIFAKNEIEFFLTTQKQCLENKVYYPNDNNSLVPYLLKICLDFNIDQPPKYDYGEYPDIDIDYIDGVREYLKEDYAKKVFGEKYVCNIANYNTYGIRSALKDMARLHSLPHEEVDAVTKNIKDKDDDGKTLTWDQTVEIFDEFRSYCEKNPEVADAARRLVGRIRNYGQHASGLVVSRVPIAEHIPLIRGKEGSVAAAWPEGLHGTDLSTVGFIKFDFLGLDGNQKIATACKLACQEKEEIEKHFKEQNQVLKTSIKVLNSIGNMTVCALPGEDQPSWSDTSYLNDPKCIEMANRGDLRMVFQFDGSPGIRNMAKEGGVDNFDDLVAYTSLFRPGTMKLGAHEQYIKRKRGKEEWTVHPALAEGPANLKTTYGVIAYQEQLMRILHTVGKIPLGDCEAVRKAVSKKKIEKFQKYKEMFITNGQETLGETVEELEKLWALVEAFSGYGFNLSHGVGYTYISSRMLWLKCHLPKQFFASMLTHTKASGSKDYEKLKEYKREAERNKVKIESLNINKSKNDFIIDNDKVYWGFCKIKGIGEDAAKRIEELQPFGGIEDFLERFGTGDKVIHPLIALGCFKEEGDPITLNTFYEVYKDYVKKESDRVKRFNKNKTKIEEDIRKLEEQLQHFLSQSKDQREIEMCEAGMRAEEDTTEEFINYELKKLRDKLTKTIANKDKRDDFAEKPTLKNFNRNFIAKGNFVDIINDLSGVKAEEAFYGFVWHHPIEKLKNYAGNTIDQFLDEGLKDGKIEVLIKEVKKTQGPKVTYYGIQIEDASYKKKKLIVWENDYERFKDELVEGKFVCIHVDAPKLPYPTFGLHQFPGGKWKMPKKESDYRVVAIE